MRLSFALVQAEIGEGQAAPAALRDAVRRRANAAATTRR